MHYSERQQGYRFSRLLFFRETLPWSFKRCKFETWVYTWYFECRHQQPAVNLCFWRKFWRSGQKRKMKIFLRPYFYKVPKPHAGRKEQEQGHPSFIFFPLSLLSPSQHLQRWPHKSFPVMAPSWHRTTQFCNQSFCSWQAQSTMSAWCYLLTFHTETLESVWYGPVRESTSIWAPASNPHSLPITTILRMHKA